VSSNGKDKPPAQAWLYAKLPLSSDDEDPRAQLAARSDGTVELSWGDETAVLDQSKLADLIDMLELMQRCALPDPEDDDGRD
jgi:hypothetical protein